MKKRKIFLCVVSVSVLINVIPLLIFKNKASLSNYSYFSVIIMIMAVIHGVFSFFLRHKRNFLLARKYAGSVFSEDKDYTFTEKYEREFFWQFCVFWFAIPFYIPCIFFVSGRFLRFLLPVCVYFIPQLIYIVYGISGTLKNVKEYRALQEKQKQELMEAQRREEMGYFK